MRDTPLFIVGAHRSGTTQLLRMCKSLLGYEGGIEGYVWQSLAVLDAHFQSVARDLGGAETPALRGFSIVEIGRERLVAAYAKHMLNLHREVYGAGLLIDKTPGEDMGLACPAIKREIPNALFIFMKRRGVENVLSYLRRFPGDAFETACSKWSASMIAWQSVKDRLRNDFIEIDQRDLATEPFATARKVSGFLKQGNVSEIASYFLSQFAESTQQGRYRDYIDIDATDWDAERRHIFEELCGPTMSAYGYEAHPVASESGTIELSSPDGDREFQISNGNEWVYQVGSALWLHPNTPSQPPVEIFLTGLLPIGRFSFKSKVSIADERCQRQTIIMSVPGAGANSSWSVQIDPEKTMEVEWEIPSFEVSEISDVILRVVLEEGSPDAGHSGTALIGARFHMVP